MNASRLMISLALLTAAAGCAGDTTSAEAGDETGEALLGGPARGISILEVEANQGTAVLLSEGEDYVPGDQRNAYLVSGRDTLIRFQHTIADPEAWIPRELTAILHVYPPEGEELTRERTFFVEADSDPRNITTNFYFSLLADEAVPGTGFWLELRETDPELDVSDLAEGVAAVPAEAQPFGFELSPQKLEVVIVPVDYRGVEPPRLVEPTEEDLALFHDDLLQQNPVQTIDISVREPMVWDEQLTNLGDLLGPTRAIKIEDDAPANVYYHALVDVGGPSVNMVAGIANLANGDMSDGDRRVAATVFYKQFDPGDEETGEEPRWFPPTGSSRTWVHEIGHNQGLRHVYCPGADAAGPDPDYPYDDGKIGVHGFGIRNFHMYTPNASHDYMSYCGNSWVSDWTWNKTFERIQTLTSWDAAGVPATTPRTSKVLVGTLFADGSENWWVYDAPAPAEPSGAHELEFWRAGELLTTRYAAIDTLSDGETLVISAALPAEGLELDAISRVDHHGVRHPVELEQIRIGREFAHANRLTAR
jgi:hypothetical protein